MAIGEGHDLPEITQERLRQHFREQYLLKEPQIDLMLQSAAQSLQHGLKGLAEAEEHQALIAIYHGLKGLFLNMGEAAWADYIRTIEGRLKGGETLDHQAFSAILRRAVDEILSLAERKEQ